MPQFKVRLHKKHFALDILFAYIMSKTSSSCESPRIWRVLFDYVCPCLAHKYNQHQSQTSTMEPKEETLADIHLTAQPAESKHQSSQASSHKLTQMQSVLVQSTVDIPLSEHWEAGSRQDYQQMQSQYEIFTKQCRKRQVRQFSIDKHPLNRLFVLGSPEGRMLCKIKSVWVEPSAEAVKKTMESSDKQKTNDPVIEKYWANRYYLFGRFDEGMQLDQESWFSVTPQAVAQHIAARFQGCSQVLDGFCGAGGDSIQLSKRCHKVIANDIDPVKTGLLKNNACVYGSQNITATTSDFLDIKMKRGEVQGVYFSPPWGGPNYNQAQWMHPQDFSPPLGALIKKGLALSDNIGMLLPNNTDIEALPPLICKAYQSLELRPTSSCILIEKIHFMEKFRFVMVWIGSALTDINMGSELQFIYGMLGDRQTYFPHRRVIKRVREEYGMVKLLNSLFLCQRGHNINIENSLYSQFQDYIIKEQLINSEKLAELHLLEQADMERQQKSQVKKDKLMLSSIGKNRRRRRVKRQLSHTIEQDQKEEEEDHVEPTVSYVSRFSKDSALGDSRLPYRFSASHEPILIEKIKEAVSENPSDDEKEK